MSRYSKTRIVKNRLSEKQHITSIEYPEIPISDKDTWVQVFTYDRLDNLANKFYRDPSLWWIIARANNMKFNNIPTGTTIRIPANIESINLD